MCNINEHTTLKSVTVYKRAISFNNQYYSPFAGTPIAVGPVIKQTHENCEWANEYLNGDYFSRYNLDNPFFNHNMIGKCSGFKHLNHCNALLLGNVTLKIVLSGEIMKGDANSIGIGGNVPRNTIVYAGSIIKSIEEVTEETTKKIK